MTGLRVVIRRVGVCCAAVVAAVNSTAGGQSTWQVGQVSPVSTLYAPPAVTFDSQNVAHVVFVGTPSSSSLQHFYASGAGANPTWNGPLIAVSSGISGGGQTYLAAAGQQVYLAYRAYAYQSAVLARLFSGGVWQSWPFPLNDVNVCGAAVDATGQVQWVARGIPLSGDSPGYYLTSRDTSGTVTVSAVALGTGGLPFANTPDKVLRQGGQAVIDTYGYLHTVQYYERGSGLMLYAKGPIAGPFTVMDNLDTGWRAKIGWPSIAVDPSGVPHIAYTEGWPFYGVKHLAWTGSSWSSEWVERGGSAFGNLGTFPQVLADSTGVIHVVYADPLHGCLKHAVKTQGFWQIETIDSVGTQAVNGFLAGALAAAVDGLGGIGLVYWDAVNGQLKYAYRPAGQ
jgi:hypothetical protein